MTISKTKIYPYIVEDSGIRNLEEIGFVHPALGKYFIDALFHCAGETYLNYRTIYDRIQMTSLDFIYHQDLERFLQEGTLTGTLADMYERVCREK